MELQEIGYVCIIFTICMIVGTIANYIMHKWTLLFKILLCCYIFLIMVFFSMTYIYINPFSIPRLVFVGGLIGVISHFIVVWFKKQMINPVRDINNCLVLLSKGDFTARVDNENNDELGQIARNLNMTISEISLLINAIKENTGENHEMAENLSGLSKNMAEKAESTSGKTNAVASSSEKVNMNMTTISADVEQATQNMEKVAGAVEETTSTISNIAKNSDKAKNITDDAVERSRVTSENMEDLGRAAKDITRITETITDISEQTNLLALNATIEAARAGESGKGFAVVAGEIKELARQTAEATQNIKNMVEGVQKTSETTVNEIASIMEIIIKGNDVVSTIASDIEEQSITIRGIADNVGQASQGISAINERVAKSLVMTEDISAQMTGINEDTMEISGISSSVKMSTLVLSDLAKSLQKQAERFSIIENEVVT